MLYAQDVPERALRIYAKDYQHGHAEPAHQHACAQLIQAVQGVIRVSTTQGLWVIPPGRGVWVPAFTEHSLKMRGAVKLRTLFVDPLARADLAADCRVISISPLLRELILSGLKVEPNYLPGSREERLMELILDELRTLPIVPLNLPMPESECLLMLCDEVQRNLAAPWDLAYAASRSGVSARTLSRQFQRETGLSFIEWLRRKRLLESLEALAMGHNIVDVALLVGYDSPSAYSSMFRRCLGVSPSEYLGL